MNLHFFFGVFLHFIIGADTFFLPDMRTMLKLVKGCCDQHNMATVFAELFH